MVRMEKKFVLFLFWSLVVQTGCVEGGCDGKSRMRDTEGGQVVTSEGVPLADPFVLVFEGMYYVYGTSVGDGFEVYRSRDLVCWERASALSLSRADSYGESRFWAPEVYYPRSTFIVDMAVIDGLVSLGGNFIRPVAVNKLPDDDSISE